MGFDLHMRVGEPGQCGGLRESKSQDMNLCPMRIISGLESDPRNPNALGWPGAAYYGSIASTDRPNLDPNLHIS